MVLNKINIANMIGNIILSVGANQYLYIGGPCSEAEQRDIVRPK